MLRQTLFLRWYWCCHKDC